jgi:hypothetical protein
LSSLSVRDGGASVAGRAQEAGDRTTDFGSLCQHLAGATSASSALVFITRYTLFEIIVATAMVIIAPGTSAVRMPPAPMMPIPCQDPFSRHELRLTYLKNNQIVV